MSDTGGYGQRGARRVNPGAFTDDADCGRCGKAVHLPTDQPCPHGYVACPDCTWVTVCFDCRRDAELTMFASGVYDPRADPFRDHTADQRDADYAARRPREDPTSPGTFHHPEAGAS